MTAGWPTARDIRREIGYSLPTLLVFAALGCAVVALIVRPASARAQGGALTQA